MPSACEVRAQLTAPGAVFGISTDGVDDVQAHADEEIRTENRARHASGPSLVNALRSEVQISFEETM